MEFITIAEFAEKAGVTPQAVYKRIKADLEPFLKVENGVKLLNKEALNLFNVKQPSNQSAYIKELEDLVTQLKEENFGLTQRLTENNEKLLEILEKQAQQFDNFQVLLSQAQQVQQSLMQLQPTVERLNEVEERCMQLETTKRKPKFFGLFNKKQKV